MKTIVHKICGRFFKKTKIISYLSTRCRDFQKKFRIEQQQAYEIFKPHRKKTTSNKKTSSPAYLILLFLLVGCSSQLKSGATDSDVLKSKVRSSSQSSEKNCFDFNKWKNTLGSKLDIKLWREQNPKSFNRPRAYDENCAKNCFINLGPLGLRTLMHDASWGYDKAYRNIYPQALCDNNGLIFNNFEILGIQKGSPAFGYIQPGDLLLEIDDTPFLSATTLPLNQEIDILGARGLEFHAGQLIDQAEARGKIKLKVLRLPKKLRNSPGKYSTRKWKTLKTGNLDTPFEISMPVTHGQVVRVNIHGNWRDVKKHQILSNVILSNGKESIPLRAGSSPVTVPPGKWTLAGSVTSKSDGRQCTIETIPAVSLPDELKQYARIVEFPLPRFGSFGKVYNPNSQKAMNTAHAMAYALSLYQAVDGGWEKIPSYTGRSFYTSIAGLALMATGNPSYDENIRRAAHFVGNKDARIDGWSYVRGINFIFLCEYYLRFRDKSIIPAIKKHISLARQCVLADYTAGHSAGKPGYGGSGWIGPGSVICCGFTLAEKCGLLNEEETFILDKMLERVQQLAPNGQVPYTRKGARTLEVKKGHGGGSGTGAYFSAALMRGGPKHFIEATAKRYTTAPYGTAECGHATQTIHFFWSSLAIFNASTKAHIDNMSAYLWKFVTYRSFGGLANQNNAMLELHSGDFVLGSPFWRTASFIILLNAHKKNLAITGKTDYQSNLFKDYPITFFDDQAAYNYVLRNWKVVNYFLGDNAPVPFTSAFKKIKKLEAGKNLGKQLFTLLDKELPAVFSSLNKMNWTDKRITKAQILRLVSGTTFEYSCSIKPPKRLDKTATKEERKAYKEKQDKRMKSLADGTIKKNQDYLLKIIPKSLISRFGVGANLKTVSYPSFRVKGRATVIDPSQKHLKSAFSFSFNIPEKVAVDQRQNDATIQNNTGECLIKHHPSNPPVKLDVKFDYKIGTDMLSYTDQISVPTKKIRAYTTNMCFFWVRGTVIEDYVGHYTLRIKLENGDVIGCETRMEKLPASFILAGTPCEFLISPDSHWSCFVKDVRILNHKVRVAGKPEIIITDAKFTGSPDALTDYDLKTTVALGKDCSSITVNQKFPKKVKVDSLTMLWTAKKMNRWCGVIINIEAKVDNKWLLLNRCKAKGLIKFATVSAKEFRFKLTVDEGIEGAEISELHLNKKRQVKNLMSTW